MSVGEKKWTELKRINRDFVCPETLSSPAARAAELEAFTDKVARVYGSVTTVQAFVGLRVRILREHRCLQTLTNVGAG